MLLKKKYCKCQLGILLYTSNFTTLIFYFKLIPFLIYVVEKHGHCTLCTHFRCEFVNLFRN